MGGRGLSCLAAQKPLKRFNVGRACFATPRKQGVNEGDDTR
jgi:hypothetical protein